MNYLDQLQAILTASGWSQEQLARHLQVSFPALNAWLNKRAIPRRQALININRLYLDIVGTEAVDEKELRTAKDQALSLSTNAKRIADQRMILDKLTLYLTYHTNTIEGSTMTLSDVEDVIFDHKVLSNRTAIEQTEARNHQAALLWVLEQLVSQGSQLKLDQSFIMGIHLRLMNSLIGDAGQYRRHSVRIMGAHVPLTNWAKVPEQVDELVANLASPAKDTVADLAKVHASFEQIHPFSDGNGRTGRLLMLAQALRAQLMPPIVENERRYAYYKYLELAQTKDALAPLELFIARSMDFTSLLLTDK
jgi:Fic family protein